jgi:hypothetical protein
LAFVKFRWFCALFGDMVRLVPRSKSAYSPLRTASGGGSLPASDPLSFSGGGHSAKPGSLNGAMSHNLEQARQSFRYAFYRVQGRPISLRRRP